MPVEYAGGGSKHPQADRRRPGRLSEAEGNPVKLVSYYSSLLETTKAVLAEVDDPEVRAVLDRYLGQFNAQIDFWSMAESAVPVPE